MARLRATASSQGPIAPMMLVEALRAVPDAEERLLDQILGCCLVPYDAQDQCVNQTPVAIIELRQGTTIPRSIRTRNISAIIGGFYRQYQQHRGRRRTSASSASFVVYEQRRMDG
jgi:hypothetical protein